MGGLQQTTINCGKQNIKPEKSPLSTPAAVSAARERAPIQSAVGHIVVFNIKCLQRRSGGGAF